MAEGEENQIWRGESISNRVARWMLKWTAKFEGGECG